MAQIYTLFRSRSLVAFSFILFFLLSGLSGRAQCGGGYGANIFNETFGNAATSPTTYGPALTVDKGPGTDYSTGATAYTYSASNNVQDNYYTIATSPVLAHGDWTTKKDHTGDAGGKMLIVNAAYATSVFYKRKVGGLCQNTNFLFSAWFMQVDGLAATKSCGGCLPSNVRFEVQDSLGNILDSTSTGIIKADPTGNPAWLNYSFPFNTANYSTVYVVLRNVAPGGCGNDLAIDDITFKACGPKINFIQPAGKICLNNSVSFQAIPSVGYNPPHYQWQLSTDNGTTWGDISGANSSIYSIQKVQLYQNNYQFRCLIAGSALNVRSPTCSVASPAATLQIQSQPVKFNQPPPVCQNSGLYNLTSYGVPAGGVFSGIGITGNNFDPTKGVVGPTNTVYYTVSNINTGCSSTDSTVINVLSSPVTKITASGPTTMCAGGQVQLNIVGTATIQWYRNDTLITGATGSVYYAGTSGRYKARQTNGFGCGSADSIPVTIYPAPQLFMNGGNSATCQGTATTLSTSVPAKSYKWTFGHKRTLASTTSSLTTFTGGTYTLTIVDNNNCIDSADYHLTINPLPVPIVQESQDSVICQGDSTTFGIFAYVNGTDKYQWYKSTTGAAGSYAAIPGATKPNYGATTSGFYYLTVTNINGCAGSAAPHQVTVIPPPAKPHVTASSAAPVCYPGVVNVSTPLVAGLTYQWRANGVAQPNSNTPNYTAQSSAWYSVIARNASGCSTVSDSVQVTINPKPTASTPSGILNTCGGTATTLSAYVQPGYTFQWYLNGAADAGHTRDTLKTLTSGTYFYIVSNPTGCKDTSASVMVNIFPKVIPVIQVDGPTTVCAADSATMEVTSTYSSYQWYQNGNPIAGDTSRTVRVSTLGTNQYTVKVVDNNGCTGTSGKQQIIVNPQPKPVIAPASATRFCVGGSVLLTVVNSPAYNPIIWFLNGTQINGATGGSYTASKSGNYTVVVTNSSGCTATSPAQKVIVDPIPTPILNVTGTVHLCAGSKSSFVLHALNSIAGGTYTWYQIDSMNSTGLATKVASGVDDSTYTLPAAKAGGFYYVTLKSPAPAGCTGTSDTVFVNQYTPPVSNLGSQSICAGSSTTLYSPPGKNFQWYISPTGAAGTFTAIAGATSKAYSATAAGFYQVQLQDSSNCGGTSATVQVKTNPVILATITGAAGSCPGTPAVLTATVTSSPVPANANYQWSFQPNGTGAYHKISGAVFSTLGVDSSGNYQVVISSSGYCPGTANAAYTVFAVVKPVIAKKANICVGSSFTVANTGPMLPPGDTYQWYRNYIAVGAPTGTASTLTVTTDGYYFVKVKDGNNCYTYSDTSYITTSPVPKPTIQITGPTVVCAGSVVKLYVPSQKNFTYQWAYNPVKTGPYTNLAGKTDTLLNVTANTGYYRITEFSAAGCAGKDSIYVVVDSVPHNTLPATAQLCAGSSVKLKVTTSARVVWSYRTQTNVISTADSVMANLTGTYYVKISNSGDGRCFSLDSTVVTVNPAPVASFVYRDSCRQSDTISFTNTSTIAGGTITGYQWNYGDPASGASNISASATATPGMHAYTVLGKYLVTLIATSGNGCTDTVRNTYLFKGTKPVARFTIAGNPAKVCGRQPVNLRDTSTNQYGAIIHYRWDFYTAAGKPAAVSADTVKDVTVSFPDTTVAVSYRIRESVTAQSGCTDTSSQLVTVGASPVVRLNLPQKQVCISQGLDSLRGGSPMNGTNGGTGFYTGVGVTNGVFNPKVAGLGKHPIMYTFTSGASGCSASAIDTLQVLPAPGPTSIIVPGSLTPCSKSASLTAVNSTAVNYIWLKNDTLIANADSSVYVATTSGKYTARALTSAGCSRDTSVLISLGNGPTAAFVVGSECQNLIVNFLNRSRRGDTSAVTYKWNFGDPASGANVSTATNPQHQYRTMGNAVVTLVAYSASGCTDTVSRTISVSPVDSNANFTIIANRPFCMTEPLIFQDSSNLPGQVITKYTWNFFDATNKLIRTDSGAVVFETFNTSTTSPVTYTVQEVLTTGINCPVQTPVKSFTLNPVTPLTYVRETEYDMCSYAPGFNLTGGSTVPPGQAGHGYYTGAGVLDSSMFVPSKAPVGSDVISYVFTNQYGCMSTASTQYMVHDTIVLAGQRIETMQGTVVTLNGIGALPFTFGPNGITQISSDSLRWNWSPGTGLSATNVPNPTFTAEDSINYTLTVTSPFGCISRTVFKIIVHKLLHVPNTFTPNGDGTNDNWIIKGLDLYPDVQVFVFNRWGQQLFYSKGYGRAWDGLYNGKPLPMGTYYYLIKLNGQNQKPLTGPLTLLY